MSTPAANANIARHLSLIAAAQPAGVALKVPRGRTNAGDIDYLSLSFAELDTEVAAWCARLTKAGVRRGDRTLLMVRQGLPLIAAAFALFRVGAVPVIIDPGMGMKNFLAGVAHSRPRALVGIPLARVLSRLFPKAFRSVRIRIAASSSLTARLKPMPPGLQPAAMATNTAADLAAVLFTSGSTGAPKGVCYEHGMFEAQVQIVRELYGIVPGEIDLPLLPVFALFNPALGMTTIVPEIDPRRPGEVDPAKIVQAIQQEHITNSFGSPTLWRRIGDHCIKHSLTLPSLRRVLCAGAPVPASLWKDARRFLSHGRLFSPYGATEALPVASVSSEEIDSGTICGACVGRLAPGVEVRIIAIDDRPIASFAEAHELPLGETGEIVVRGPVVTKSYDDRPDATAAAKITDAAGFWHRMGDCGYVDGTGRLWFCGRKAERVETASGTLHTEPCEQVFRSHPRVTRCALIGLHEGSAKRAAIVIEAASLNSRARQSFARELRLLGLQPEQTRTINLFFFHPKFPVDVRHNAKIHRLKLAKWAATATGYEGDSKRP